MGDVIEDDSGKLGEFEQTFARNMRRLRDERGWSQEDLVSELRQRGTTYINQTSVSRIEKGTRPVRLGEAQVIAQAFDRTIAAMTTDPGLDQRLGVVSLIRDRAKAGWQRVAAAELSVREAAKAISAARKDLEVLNDIAAQDAETDPELRRELANLEEMLQALIDVNLVDEVRRGQRG